MVLACRSAERGERLRQELLAEGEKTGHTPSLEVGMCRPASGLQNMSYTLNSS